MITDSLFELYGADRKRNKKALNYQCFLNGDASFYLAVIVSDGDREKIFLAVSSEIRAAPPVMYPDVMEEEEA